MTSMPHTSAKTQVPASIGPSDVYYALFRHKWKVSLCALLGIAGSAAVYFLTTPKYSSEAKLLVRYVVDSRSVEALGPDGQVRTSTSGADNVVNSEREILMSLDLCRQVAETIGSAKIAPNVDGGSNISAAAVTLYKGLTVDVLPGSSVIRVGLTHGDPEIAHASLEKLVEYYFKRHVEVHRGLGSMDAVLAQQTDQVRSRLVQTDEELRDLRTKAGVLSLEDARRSYTEQIGNIRQMILTAEAELAEYQALITNAASPAGSSVRVSTNAPRSTEAIPTASSNPPSIVPPIARPVRNEEARKSLVARLESLRAQENDLRLLRTQGGASMPEETRRAYTDQIGRVRQMILSVEADLAERTLSAGGQASQVAPAVQRAGGTTNLILPTVAGAGPDIPGAASERYRQYRALMERLEALHREEVELKTIYKDGNRTLVRVREQLAAAEAERVSIEQANPSFVTGPGNGVGVSAQGPSTMPTGGQVLDPSRVLALEARLSVLRTQLDKQRQEASALEEFETSLTQLQRKRELDERNYRHFAAGLEQTRFDEALGSGKLANISVVQAPSPAAPNASKRMKLAAMVLAAGVLGGIALALAIELLLDHSVRRSGQLETSMALPLLSTIPRMRLGGWKAKPKVSGGDALEIPGWSKGHPMRDHIEILRDRTLMHFEGDLRKPKLIGVTGCRDGAGVTTIACALAAALSESAEGRVLLINLDPGSQSLHPFLIGHEACSVVDVVDAGKRETALIGNNLYVASGGGEGGGGTAMHPTNIARILPKIKMSDYDYVVFDMPTVSRTSISARLAGMVDLVFMVAESEKDSQIGLKKACQMLTDHNATFRLVLNKFERYVPKWLDQET